MNFDRNDQWATVQRQEMVQSAPHRGPFDRSISSTCRACGDDAIERSYLCLRCKALKNRTDPRKDDLGRNRKPDGEARLWAMHGQWDRGEKAFRCRYTNVPLSSDNRSRAYATWEHVTPGDESSVVLVADIVNKMKSSLTWDEFAPLVLALARHIENENEPFDPSAFPRDPPDLSD